MAVAAAPRKGRNALPRFTNWRPSVVGATSSDRVLHCAGGIFGVS